MSFLQDDKGVLRSRLLSEFEWLDHGFGTRLSEGWPGSYTHVRQIHSAAVLVSDGANGCLGKGDALLSSSPGTLIGVRTADCVPILIVDPKRRAVAAVHAGWRGTAQNISANAVLQLAKTYGGSPRDFHAAIGPAIGECCYEVGREVADQFRAMFPELDEIRRLDLVEANRRQLIDMGVSDCHIEASGLCTFCHAALLHSFRRDKEASGRMVAAIGLRPAVAGP